MRGDNPYPGPAAVKVRRIEGPSVAFRPEQIPALLTDSIPHSRSWPRDAGPLPRQKDRATSLQGDEDGALGSSEGPVTQRRQPYPARPESPRSSLTTPFFAPLPHEAERRKVRGENPYPGPATGSARRNYDTARDLSTPRIATLLADSNPPFLPWRSDAEPCPQRKVRSRGPSRRHPTWSRVALSLAFIIPVCYDKLET